MKKFLSVVFALILVSVCVLPAFADSMTISTGSGVTDEYQLTVPADTDIPWESPSYALGSVTATVMRLSPGKTVKVSVASANDYNLVSTTSASSKIAYTLTGADAIAFFAGDYGKSFPLSVSIADAQWQQAASGEHTDVLTFTAEYTNA